MLGAVPSTRLSQVRGTRARLPVAQRDAVFATFVNKYFEEYGDSQIQNRSFAANAYDAGWLVAYGAAWALLQEGRVSGETMARGLRRLTGGAGAERIDVGGAKLGLVLAEFAAGRAVDVEGASGPLDYSDDDEETSGPIEVWTVNASREPARQYEHQP